MSLPLERDRRKPEAAGSPVRLADGARWLLAHPTFRPTAGGLADPLIDGPLDRVFESVVMGVGVELVDVWEAAFELLNRNYDLSPDEAFDLLSVRSGAEAAALAEAVVEAVFGGPPGEKGFTRWVRASLLANGLGGTEVPARDLTDMLAVLVATNRTIPLSRFADVCLRSDERARLESLI